MIYPFLPGHNLAFDELPAGPGTRRRARPGARRAAQHRRPPLRRGGDAHLRHRLLPDVGGSPSSTGRPSRAGCRPPCSPGGSTPSRTSGSGASPRPAIHGDLTGDQVLAVFEDDSDASTGRIRGHDGVGGRQGRRPRGRLRGPRRRGRPRGRRDGPGGLRPRPRRASRPQPARARPAGRRARHPRRPHARRRPRQHAAAVEGLQQAAPARRRGARRGSGQDDYRRGSLAPVGPACARDAPSARATRTTTRRPHGRQRLDPGARPSPADTTDPTHARRATPRATATPRRTDTRRSGRA